MTAVFSALRRFLDPQHRFTTSDRRRQLRRYAVACDAVDGVLEAHGIADRTYRTRAARARRCVTEGWTDDDLRDLASVPPPPVRVDAKAMDLAAAAPPDWYDALGRALARFEDEALALRAVGQA